MKLPAAASLAPAAGSSYVTPCRHIFNEAHYGNGGHGRRWERSLSGPSAGHWTYATTLYDYIHRAMPFDAPQSLSADEMYFVIAWLLFQNQIIAEDAVIDA